MQKRSIESRLFEVVLKISGTKKDFIQASRIESILKKDHPFKFKVFYPRLLKSKLTQTSINGLDILSFESSHPTQHIVYLHGGAYVFPPSLLHFQFCDDLALKTQSKIILPLYPRAPVHSHKEAIALVIHLYSELLKTIPADQISFMGDSAGGGFALVLAQVAQLKQLPQPKHILLLSPWLDISCEDPALKDIDPLDPILGIPGLQAMGKAWAGLSDPKDPQCSPLYGNLKGIAPITTFVGTHEILWVDSRRLKDKADQESIPLTLYEVPFMNHVFALFPIPEAKEVKDKIIKILQK